MTALPTSINTSIFNTFCDNNPSSRTNSFRFKFLKPINSYTLSRRKICSFHENEFKLRAIEGRRWSSFGEKDGILMREEEWRRGKKKRGVVVRVNQFGFGGGGGGGGGRDNTRVLGNLVLAIGLTYLSFTGQLGWLLDAIVSIWLLAVILPIAGLGAFLWWAGRDMVQGSCPNCGNEFQIFKSAMKDGMQLCPYCSQPFSVEGNEFTRGSTKFDSNQSTTFGQAFNGFSPSSKKEKASSVSVVDIEAEVRDAE